MKTIFLYILFFIFLSEYSTISSHPNNVNGLKDIGIVEDTLYFDNPEVMYYDTIPYMINDRTFFDALEELKRMLSGSIPYSLKRAEFLVEWAYSGGNMDYSKFCHDIDSVTNILKHFIEVNRIGQFKTAPNYALFEYFTKPSPMNGHREFRYDFNDFCGESDFRNLFITKVMDTHTGQCTSLTLYYKIPCDEMGAQSSLAFAPRHIYVKHIGEDGKWVNIDLTNGHFVTDEWMIQTMNVSTEAIRNGIFLTALSDKENIAFMITQLGKAYQQKYKSWDFFPLRCAEEVLKVLPTFCDALVLKFCVHQQLGFRFLSTYGQVRTPYIDYNYSEFRRIMNTLDELGYSQLTDEEYKLNVERVLKDIERTTD